MTIERQTAQPSQAQPATSSGLLQRQCDCGQHTVAGGQCDACREKRAGSLQRAAIGAPPVGHTPPDASIRAFGEPRFGHDFSAIPTYRHAAGMLQTKLAINTPGDEYEREADRVADQVLAAPAHPAISGAAPRIQRFAGHMNGQAATAPASVDRALASSGTALDPALQQDMGQRFGHDFSQVRVHSSPAAEQSARDVSAHAYTVGHNIVFGAGQFAPTTYAGRRLIAHELTHVVQQTSVGARYIDQRAENRDLSPIPFAPSLAQSRYITHRTTSLGLQAQPAPPSPEIEFTLILTVGRAGMTDADAHKALDVYKKISNAKRQQIFNSLYPGGEITRLLFALKAADASTYFRDEVAQILRWVEEAETRKASGMTDDQMSKAQAKFKQDEAEIEAQAQIAAKTPKGVAPPKAAPKDVEAARKEKMKKTSIEQRKVTTWDTKPKAEKDAWIKRGEAVIKALVSYAAKNHPELKLTEGHFLADFGGVEKRGQRVLAYGQPGKKGGQLAVIGFRFVEAAEVNPAYVMSVVVHEVFGHPEYGTYGTEYHLALYDKAQAKMPGYKKPTDGTPERTSELDAYAYQETEIYSLLRSFSYHTPIAAADSGKGLVSIDPKTTVAGRLGLMKQQWEPKLAVSIVRGLYQRLLQDPRITGAAINAFRDGVKAQFPVESNTILK